MAERVVFDTNVLVAGLIWRGKPYQCLLLARARLVQAMYCDEALAELTSKLRSKFEFTEDRIRAVVYDLTSFSERVAITNSLRVVQDDPDDDKFLECASLGGAKTLVSRDRHLLALGVYEGIRIVTPTQFIEESRR